MNSTEPDANFERSLALIQHVSGVILLIFNALILIVIASDSDGRSAHYRKYLCCVQISSLAFDTLSDLYAPYFMMHKGLFYSDSILSSFLSMGKFLATEMVIIAEVTFSYFACVYYRRGVVLPRESFFNLYGWRRNILFVFLQAYAFIIFICTVHFYNKSLDSSEVRNSSTPGRPIALPVEFYWVREKPTHLFMLPDANTQYAHYVSDPGIGIIVLVTIAMLVQLVAEVRKGMYSSSASTRKYQRLAVQSLVLQGAVPSFVYTIPSYTNTCIQFAPAIFNLGVGFDQFANVLSPILWVIITKHTFVSSLTILYCSPSYRKKIATVFRRPHKIAPDRMSAIEEHSVRTI